MGSCWDEELMWLVTDGSCTQSVEEELRGIGWGVLLGCEEIDVSKGCWVFECGMEEDTCARRKSG